MDKRILGWIRNEMTNRRQICLELIQQAEFQENVRFWEGKVEAYDNAIEAIDRTERIVT